VNEHVLSEFRREVVARKLLRGGHEPLRSAEASNCSFVGRSAASPARPGRGAPCAEAVGLPAFAVSSAMYLSATVFSRTSHSATTRDRRTDSGRPLARLEPAIRSNVPPLG